MRIVIVGGHLSPALAVIDALSKDTKILFIGRKHTFEGDPGYSLEYNTIKSLKIPFASIATGRLQRKFTRHTIPSLFKIPYGFMQAFSILYRFKPDVALSFGGYVSLPVVLAAYLVRIPIVIHEQTLKAGLANRVLSYFATKVCVSYETSKPYFPKHKTILTGNPIRKFQIQNSKLQINSKFKIPNEHLPIIYITGGSAGSHFINTLIEKCIRQLLEKFVVIHQTGDSKEHKDFDRFSNLKNLLPTKLKNRYILKKFVDYKELGKVFKKSTLVISRAGINTVFELIYFGKPGILIPIPFSQNNEQLTNALFFKKLGLGEVLEQKFINENLLLQKIEEMVNNIERYIKNREKASSIIDRSSADKIVEIVKNVKKDKDKTKKRQRTIFKNIIIYFFGVFFDFIYFKHSVF